MNVYFFSLNILIFLVLAFTPYYNRKSILFGYRLGEKLGRSEEAQQIRKRYVVRLLMIVPIITLAVFYLPMRGEIVGLVHMGFFLACQYLMYAWGRQESRELYLAHQGEINYQNKVVVSTAKRKIGVSPVWFLVSLLIILMMFVIIFAYYEQIPQQMPLRYDLKGNVTGYEEKSIWELSKLPLISLVTTAILFYSFMVTGRAKDELSGKNIRRSLKDSKRFKQVVARMLVYLSVYINLFFFYTFLTMIRLVPFNIVWHNIIIFGSPLLILGPFFYLAVKVGQDGSRLETEQEQETIEDGEEVVIDDNEQWKLGLFYYNPTDPSVWVPKRFGIGRTLNFARTEAWVFVASILILIALGTIFGL